MYFGSDQGRAIMPLIWGYDSSNLWSLGIGDVVQIEKSLRCTQTCQNISIAKSVDQTSCFLLYSIWQYRWANSQKIWKYYKEYISFAYFITRVCVCRILPKWNSFSNLLLNHGPLAICWLWWCRFRNCSKSFLQICSQNIWGRKTWTNRTCSNAEDLYFLQNCYSAVSL